MKNILFKILFISILSLTTNNLFSQINVGTNFNIVANLPIDKRIVVNNYSDLLNITWLYNGLLVYVNSEQTYYYYDGSVWKKLVSSYVGYETFDIVLLNANSVFNQNTNNKIAFIQIFDDSNNNIILNYNINNTIPYSFTIYNESNTNLSNLKAKVYYEN